MKEEWKDIVTNEMSAVLSIDFEKLSAHTKKMTGSEMNSFPWMQLRYLHILGFDSEYSFAKGLVPSEPPADRKKLRGFYVSDDNAWMLLLDAPKKTIGDVISCCTWQLRELDVRYTKAETLDVSRLVGLKTLKASFNLELKSIFGLPNLTALQMCDLSNTQMHIVMNLDKMLALEEIMIEGTKIERIVLSHTLPRMKRLFAGNSGVRDFNFLKYMPNLEKLGVQDNDISQLPPVEHLTELIHLNLAFTQIKELPDISRMKKLEYLTLHETEVSDVDSVCFPHSLKLLRLSATRIRRIPDSIRGLTNLIHLDISHLDLEEIPDWLPELGLNFQFSFSEGINLYNVCLNGEQIGIFEQSNQVILDWFEKRKRGDGSDLNEVKVVFLGDGEAGKTHTIARLLKGGELLTAAETPDDATPGIVINDRFYDLDGRRIQVHFWDFGGQEILHSMHRIFLTERTLYVVLLNARDNTQNERARYWLHNIRSFAGDAPVLLVLNKTDQNEHATVNISDLREICPNLPEAVYLSALKDSPLDFNRKLTGAMLDAIRKIDTIRTFFPNSWKQVKDALQTMETPYIKGGAYKQLCDDNRVDEKIQRDVLDLFKTLGVSFYYPGVKLEDYVVLRPDWITNAIYIILFNKRNEVKNGLISHETIYRLLNPRPGDAVKRVLPDATYSNEEVTYVLDVVRRFRLSYLVEDGMEFIPALCDSNSPPVAAQYAADPNALEFRMKFDYLPNNVLHRLMVELRQHLDREHVWLTGALFRERSKGFSAVVKTEGNLLRIFVRAEKPRYTADMYLDTIRDALDRINADMNLKVAENQVVYKADGIVECYNYDDLILSQELGDTTVTSRVRRKKVSIADILSQTDHWVDAARETLIGDILSACRSLQASQIYWTAGENDRNTYIRDILRTKGYFVADQTRSGISAGGKQAGELDLDIRRETDMPWTILEALNLGGKGDSQIAYWDDHLKKLLDNYNANGLPFLLQVSYVECPKDKFGTLCTAYSEHLRFHSPAQYNLQLHTAPGGYGENHFIQAHQCVYDCDGFPTTVYHFFVRMGE